MLYNMRSGFLMAPAAARCVPNAAECRRRTARDLGFHAQPNCGLQDLRPLPSTSCKVHKHGPSTRSQNPPKLACVRCRKANCMHKEPRLR